MPTVQANDLQDLNVTFATQRRKGDMDDAELGKRLRLARETAGWSVRALAEKLGLDGPLLSRTEAGSRALKARELVAASAALGVPLDVLVGGRSVDLDVAARRAEALAEPVGGAVADWLVSVSRAAALFRAEVSDALPAELEAAAIWGDSGGLPERRTVTLASGTVGVAHYLLAELVSAFTFAELPPIKDEDKDNGG
ncbi:helix-turn-helix domain-containing protein [Mycolicibacter acidiphilus]|nr:helix-turn-helix transcriptional regulator [Mycolicibacter acidiphilus]